MTQKCCCATLSQTLKSCTTINKGFVWFCYVFRLKLSRLCKVLNPEANRHGALPNSNADGGDGCCGSYRKCKIGKTAAIFLQVKIAVSSGKCDIHILDMSTGQMRQLVAAGCRFVDRAHCLIMGNMRRSRGQEDRRGDI